jgi:excisionase family DNA binding protein
MAPTDMNLMTTKEAAVRSGYSQDHIALLLRRGVLAGNKMGRDWFVDEKALNTYVKSNPKPGRKKR